MITAGGIPEPGEPLYAFSQGQSKALIDVAGKPMIQWILDALSGARSIKNVLIVGLDGTEGLACKKMLHYLPNQGGMPTSGNQNDPSASDEQGGMEMMKQRQQMMQKHMQTMEKHMANIEALLQQLVDQGKKK